MHGTLRYSHPTAASTVLIFRNGRLRELRRGELTGSALRAAGQRHWENIVAWKSDMPAGGEFCSTSQALLAPPTPTPVLEVNETATAFKKEFAAALATPATAPAPAPAPVPASTPRELCCAEIARMLDSVELAVGSNAKCAASSVLFSYILRDTEVAALIAERPVFASTVRAKCREFFRETKATPPLIAAIGAVLAKFWPDDYAELVEGRAVTPEVVAEKRIALYAALGACHSAEGREALERMLLAEQREFRVVFAADSQVAAFVRAILTREVIKSAFF
ncbi:hypothetical protein EBZ80_23460 [bacterium]|nr:hypothetical protein [bacterium]